MSIIRNIYLSWNKGVAETVFVTIPFGLPCIVSEVKVPIRGVLNEELLNFVKMCL